MAWIEASISMPGKTPEETGSILNGLSKKYFPGATTHVDEQNLHVTVLYIGEDLDPEHVQAIRKFTNSALYTEPFFGQFMPTLQLGDTNKKVVLWEIMCPKLGELFVALRTTLMGMGVDVKHTLQDKGRFLHGYCAHVTMAEYATEESAADEWIAFSQSSTPAYADFADKGTLIIDSVRLFLGGDDDVSICL